MVVTKSRISLFALVEGQKVSCVSSLLVEYE